MTEDQITTAIAVLKAYADGTLQTDQCDELDEALIKAYNTWIVNTVEHYDEDEQHSNFGYASEYADE